jgi:hypothetical protein
MSTEQPSGVDVQEGQIEKANYEQIEEEKFSPGCKPKPIVIYAAARRLESVIAKQSLSTLEKEGLIEKGETTINYKRLRSFCNYYGDRGDACRIVLLSNPILRNKQGHPRSTANFLKNARKWGINVAVIGSSRDFEGFEGLEKIVPNSLSLTPEGLTEIISRVYQ